MGKIDIRRCRLDMVTVEPVLFLYMFASNLQYPAFQALVYKKTCLSIYNASFCGALDEREFQEAHREEEDEIQGQASYWIMLSNVGMTVPATLVVFFFLGSWGDKGNRKVPILIPCAGSLLYNLSNVLNAYFTEWPLDYLMVGPVFNGLFGSYITLLMGVYSYITHISSDGAKTTRVGIVESMTFFAGTISVFVSGLLLRAIGFVYVFTICCGCVGLAALYGFALLKSVRPEVDQGEEKGFCQYWVVDALKDTVAFMKKPREGKIKTFLVLEIIIINIMQMCTTGEMDILFLYLKRYPRSFTPVEYGYFKGSENFSRSVTLLTVLPVLKQWFVVRDTTVMIVGVVSKACGLVLLGLATNLTMVFFVVVFAMFQGFPAAGLRSHMTSMVDKDEQGRLFAVVAATESCVTLITTFIFNGWYPETLDTFSGTCFMFAAGMCVLALALVIYIHVRTRPTQSQDPILESYAMKMHTIDGREDINGSKQVQ